MVCQWQVKMHLTVIHSLLWKHLLHITNIEYRYNLLYRYSLIYGIFIVFYFKQAQHNVPPLQSNDNLSKIAQTWADTLAKTQQMQHSPENWRRFNGSVLGENLAYLYGQVLTGTKMTDMWYQEEAKHDYNFDEQPDSQHFSQLVWKDSKEVGFGRAKALNGNWYYGVALYSPAGNTRGFYRANVYPPVV